MNQKQPQIKRREFSQSLAIQLDGFSPLLMRVFAHRGITDQSQLDYRLSNLCSPATMLGVKKAGEILASSIEKGERILIVGDFDADGATSSALATHALQAMGAQSIEYLVPNRFDYGYGLTPEIVDVAAEKTPDVIVTVDNGISSVEGVERANSLGIRVVVTDHHLPGNTLPNAQAIVNPNQPGCNFPGKSLAGVGVIFYVLSQVRSLLDQNGWFERQRIEKPNMANYLDLVALGTVADVVTLDDQNRLLVHQGLQRMRAGRVRPGIRALFDVSKRSIESAIASDIGFGVAPRINAAGRLDDMSLGIRCLLAENYDQARELASELNDLNQDRRAIESSMQQEALKSLAELKNLHEDEQPWGMCLFNEQWHQGVIGILASRIKDQFHRPVIAFAQSDNSDEIKGSARSIAGIHIRDALDAVATSNPGLIEKFGGHAMAAGLTIQKHLFSEFCAAFDSEIRRVARQENFTAQIFSDGELTPEEFNLENAHQLRNAGPWGQNFPEPTFDGEFLLLTQRLVGEKHLKMTVAPASDAQTVIDAIAFNVNLQCWPDPNVRRIRAAYQLDVNEFRGKESVQLRIEFLQALE